MKIKKSTGVEKVKGSKKGPRPVAKPKALQRFWAVQVGRNPGVYTDHERFQQQIDGFSGAVSKRFYAREEAEAFVAGPSFEARFVHRRSRRSQAFFKFTCSSVVWVLYRMSMRCTGAGRGQRHLRLPWHHAVWQIPSSNLL